MPALFGALSLSKGQRRFDKLSVPEHFANSTYNCFYSITDVDSLVIGGAWILHNKEGPLFRRSLSTF